MVAEVSMIADFVIQDQRNDEKFTRKIILLQPRERIIASMSKFPLGVLL
jgi:hypothetical protein